MHAIRDNNWILFYSIERGAQEKAAALYREIYYLDVRNIRVENGAEFPLDFTTPEHISAEFIYCVT